MEEGLKSSGAGVTDGCEPADGCWEPNLGLKQQYFFLTIELFLVPGKVVFFSLGRVCVETVFLYVILVVLDLTL